MRHEAAGKLAAQIRKWERFGTEDYDAAVALLGEAGDLLENIASEPQNAHDLRVRYEAIQRAYQNEAGIVGKLQLRVAQQNDYIRRLRGEARSLSGIVARTWQRFRQMFRSNLASRDELCQECGGRCFRLVEQCNGCGYPRNVGAVIVREDGSVEVESAQP